MSSDSEEDDKPAATKLAKSPSPSLNKSGLAGRARTLTFDPSPKGARTEGGDKESGVVNGCLKEVDDSPVLAKTGEESSTHMQIIIADNKTMEPPIKDPLRKKQFHFYYPML